MRQFGLYLAYLSVKKRSVRELKLNHIIHPASLKTKRPKNKKFESAIFQNLAT